MFTPSLGCRKRFLGISFILDGAGKAQGQDRAFQQEGRSWGDQKMPVHTEICEPLALGESRHLVLQHPEESFPHVTDARVDSLKI